ncbi:MAG: flagellar export protein FliJ [Pseudomonadota bacterium]
MQPIKELIDTREKNMARQVAECRRTLTERETRLKELTEYRDSYLEKNNSNVTSSPVHLQEYQVFIGKLNLAITEQARLVQTVQADLETLHAQWADTKARSNAVGKAVDRFRETERIQLNRKEQKENDEIATSRFKKLKE